MLDAVVDYLPSPLDIPPVTASIPRPAQTETRERRRQGAVLRAGVQDHERPARRPARLPARVLRHARTRAPASTTRRADKKERVGRLLRMHANKREEIESISAGDIAAVVGLKDTRTGDTLCDPDKPIVLESMDFPEPGHRGGHRAEDQGRRGEARACRWPGWPWRTRRSRSTSTRRRTRPSSTGWASCTSRSSSTACCASSRSRPTSASRRSPTARPSARRREAQGRFVRQTGGRGQYGDVWLEVEPAEAGRGLRVREQARRAPSIPREYVPAVEKGIKEAARDRRARRLPDGRHQGRPDRRQLPRGRLERDGLQDRRRPWASRRPAARPSPSCSSP